jgi:transcription antitermination factor NusG
MDWYLLRTIYRRESVAAEALGKLGIETVAPRIHAVQRTIYRVNPVVAPLFASYIFARLDLEAMFDRVRRAHGVASFVRFNTSIPAVPQVMIEEIRNRMDEDGFVKLDDAAEGSASGYKADDVVMVTGGPFAGMAGLFRRDVDAIPRVVLLLKLLGREFEHAVDLSDTRAAYVTELAYT